MLRLRAEQKSVLLVCSLWPFRELESISELDLWLIQPQFICCGIANVRSFPLALSMLLREGLDSMRLLSA